jgi:hypothetical protein
MCLASLLESAILYPGIGCMVKNGRKVLCRRTCKHQNELIGSADHYETVLPLEGFQPVCWLWKYIKRPRDSFTVRIIGCCGDRVGGVGLKLGQERAEDERNSNLSGLRILADTRFGSF